MVASAETIGGPGAPRPLPTEAERRRGIIVLLATTFLMYAGFFMVIPLLSVHYVDGLGWSAALVGLVLGVRQAVQQGLAFAGGIIADRFGAKAPLVAGMFVRGLGFGGMAWADSSRMLFATAILAALGGALFEAPRSAAIAALTTEANRSRVYSLSGVIGGLGLTIGPLVGAFLLRFDFSVVALVSGAIYLLTTVVSWVGMPAVRVASGGPGRLTAGLGMAVRDRTFVTFTVLGMGVWFMWVQLTISLPLAATAIAGTSDAVAWLYVLNAVLTIVLQYPLIRLAERWLRPMPILMAGTALMAAGLATVGVAPAIGPLLGGVAIFSAGSVLAQPSLQTVTASLANPAALGAFFGVGMYALAVGGGVGNVLGGYLYGLGQRLDLPALPWLVFAAVGFVTAAGFWALDAARQRVIVSPDQNPALGTPISRSR